MTCLKISSQDSNCKSCQIEETPEHDILWKYWARATNKSGWLVKRDAEWFVQSFVNFPSRNPARKQSWQHCFHIILLEGVEHQHPGTCHHYWVYKESRHDPLDPIHFLPQFKSGITVKLFRKGKWRCGVPMGALWRTLFITARALTTCTRRQKASKLWRIGGPNLHITLQMTLKTGRRDGNVRRTQMNT